MWSKRRKKFARKYDADKHRIYLFERWFSLEVSRRISEKLEKAILFGIEDEEGER